MKNIKITVNLTEFITKGKFGFIDLGMSKSELISQLFAPEDWGIGDNQDNARIWRNGNFELHFDDQQKVIVIHNDYLTEIDGGKYIFIEDYWLLGKTFPTLLEVMENLNALYVDFKKIANRQVGLIYLELDNFITLYFDNDHGQDANENHFKLGSAEKVSSGSKLMFLLCVQLSGLCKKDIPFQIFPIKFAVAVVRNKDTSPKISFDRYIR